MGMAALHPGGQGLQAGPDLRDVMGAALAVEFVVGARVCEISPEGLDPTTSIYSTIKS
jgi:hypothetical protein